MTSLSEGDSLRRSKRNKFHLDVAAIMSQHSDRRLKSVSPPRKRLSEPTGNAEKMRAKGAAKSVSTAVGKRERKVPVRHLDFVSDEHLDPKSDGDDSTSKTVSQKKEVKKNEVKDFQCSHCPAHYPSRKGLANHTKQHGSMKKYRCDECDMSCNSIKTLRVHSQVHFPDEGDLPLITFTQRSKIADAGKALEDHREEVDINITEESMDDKDVSEKREDEDEGVDQKTDVANTLTDDSSPTMKDQSGSSSSKGSQLECKECPFKTRDMGRLAIHQVGHRRERGYQCPMCTYRSESAGFLKRHCCCHGKGEYPWPPVYVGRAPITKKTTPKRSLAGADAKNHPVTVEESAQNVVRKTKTRKVTALLLPARSSKSLLSTPAGNEVQNEISKSVIPTSAPAAISLSTRKHNSKVWGRRFITKSGKRMVCYLLPHTKGLGRRAAVIYKCVCCSARFGTYHERSLHHAFYHRAHRISKTVYTALLKERMDAFTRDEKPLADAFASDDGNSVERLRRCAHCPFTCMQKSRLQRHENKHFVKAEHQCTHCSFSCRSMDILTQHLRLHQPSRIRQMPGRPKDFSLTEDILSGGSASTLTKVEKCSECPYRSRHLCDMKAHAAMHVGMREFPCNRCTYSTKRAHVLEAHLQMHAEEDGLPISLQQSSMIGGAKRRISIRWKGKTIGTRSGSKLTRVYACYFCPFRTRFCAPLFVHYRNHMGHRSLRCTRCTFNTSISRKFREHCALHPLTRGSGPSSKNTHADNVFICRECPYSCDSYGKLWHHAQKHKKVSRFGCDLCTFSTGSANCLAEHRALHTPPVATQSKMEKIIIVSDLYSMRECEVLNDAEDIPAANGHTDVDSHSNGKEACDAQKASDTSLSTSEDSKKEADEVSQESGPTKDNPSSSLFEDENLYKTNYSELFHRIRESRSSLPVASSKSYQCNECPFTSEDKAVLAFHADKHKAKTGHFKCDMCSYKVHTPEALCNHITLHAKAHPEAAAAASFRKRKIRRASPESIPQNGKALKCTKCDYQTAVTDRYVVHCLEHALRTQRRLETSIRRSKGNDDDSEKKRKSHRLARKLDGQQYCNKCSFRCDSESALGTHMELHGLSAPFICTVCDYGSFSQNVVRFHEMNHHLDAPLTTLCKDASSKTDQSKKMIDKASSDMSSREQTIRCNRCGYIVHNFIEFTMHCNVVHSDTPPNVNSISDEHTTDDKDVEPDSSKSASHSIGSIDGGAFS
uniref:Suppressor of presenilin protein 4 n=1 Tax=Ascaris suum TaxID=6253 RepID=F1KSL1_ASCSU